MGEEKLTTVFIAPVTARAALDSLTCRLAELVAFFKDHPDVYNLAEDTYLQSVFDAVDTLRATLENDWTEDEETGHSNSSPAFLKVIETITRYTRATEPTARIAAAQLAHVLCMRPVGEMVQPEINPHGNVG